MRLIRFGAPGKEKPGIILNDETMLDVSGFSSDFDEAFFENDGIRKLQNWLQKNSSKCPVVDKSTRLGPPIAKPSKIICVGLNYRKHAAESGMAVPAEPVLFFKAPSAITGPRSEE